MMSADVRALNPVIRDVLLSNDLNVHITCLFFVIALIADDRNSVEWQGQWICEMMQNITITTLITLGLAIPAMAAATVPEEYQGVWAAAQDCKQNFQNVLPHVVNREHDTCRVMQVLSSGHPAWHTDTIYLNCGGSRSREIWHDENIDGTDFLVTMQFDRVTEVGRPAIYKRCPEIPLGEIPLSDIPGNETRR